jgi:hypothetical protein
MTLRALHVLRWSPFLAWMAAAPAMAQPLPAGVRVVHAGAAPGGNGLAWATAYNDLHNALDAASASGGQVTELWVAQGEYRVRVGEECVPFTVANVSLYGGFAGVETSRVQRPAGTRSQIIQGGYCTNQTPAGLNIVTIGPVVIDRFFVGTSDTVSMRIQGPTTLTSTNIHGGPFGAIEKLTPSPLCLVDCIITAGTCYRGPPVNITGPGTVVHCQLSINTNFFEALVLRDLDLTDCTISAVGDTSGVSAYSVSINRCAVLGAGDSASLGLLGDDLDVVESEIVVHGYEAARFINGGSMVRSRLTAPGPSLVKGLVLDGTTVQSSVIELAAGMDFVELRGAPLIANSRFTGYSARYGITGPDASPRFVNCLFQHGPNFAQYPAWRAFNIGPGWRFDNCIVWEPPPGAPTYPPQLTFEVPAGTMNFVNHSIVRGWTGQYGGIANSGADPQLDENGMPESGSPAVDAGDNASVPIEVTHDLARNCRVADGDGNGTRTVDMGPFELTPCFANCDCSHVGSALSVSDFTCFLQRYAAGDAYANCDNSTTAPVLNVQDFTCFLQRYAAGCP